MRSIGNGLHSTPEPSSSKYQRRIEKTAASGTAINDEMLIQIKVEQVYVGRDMIDYECVKCVKLEKDPLFISVPRRGKPGTSHATRRKFRLT